MSPSPITVINPASGEEVGTCQAATVQDIDQAVKGARHAFDAGPWPRLSHPERAEILLELARHYVDEAEQMGALITAQNGSPAAFTAQVSHPAAIATYYAGLAWEHPWSEIQPGGLQLCREPVGVVAAIVPWNMPQKTIMMKLAPALLAGCTVVIKPAPETPLDALDLAGWLDNIGLPEGVVSVVPAWPSEAWSLVQHHDVDKVAFTGSARAGAQIAAAAAGRGARISLELGGKSAALVLPDADHDQVIASLQQETFTLAGQICSAHTRLLVPAHLHRWYTEAAAAAADALIVGDPTDPATQVGPVISGDARQRLLTLIRQATRTGGGTLITGGTAPDRPGWYLSPTVLAEVDPLAPVAQLELFGPVLCLIPYDDLDQAVAIANGVPYDLEAAIWTGQLDIAAGLAHRLRAGTVRINGAAAPIWSPLGGFRHSGVGRELGEEGLHHYLETKAVIVTAMADLG